MGDRSVDLALDAFPVHGCARIGDLLDEGACAALAQRVRDDRPIESLFKTEAEFMANPTWTRCNPGPGINLLEHYDTGFIDDAPAFTDAMTRLAGPGYRILDKKIVRSISREYLPAWVDGIMRDCGQANVNPFIRPEYQDVTHFSAADWHQDHYRACPISNFVTVYIYLEDTGPNDSPLRLLPGTHVLGCTPCPHAMRPSSRVPGLWYYWDEKGTVVESQDQMVTGRGVSAFHAMTLHGTKPNRAATPRVSLRYLVATAVGEETGDSLLGRCNARIPGDLSVALATRHDINPDGSYRPLGNALDMYSPL
jgi:hypothetical protein